MRLLCCLLITGISASLYPTLQAEAQGSGTRLATYIEVDPAAAEHAADLIESWAQAGASARGSRMFTAARRLGRDNHFVVLEVWDSANALATWAQSEQATDFRAALEPLLISPPDLRTHNDLNSADAASVAAGGIIVVTHVDVFRPHIDSTVALMNTLVSASRAEDGNAQFDVWVTIDRPNHMTVVEAWESVAARDRHVTAPHTRAFRASLVTSIGALYDERLYRVY